MFRTVFLAFFVVRFVAAAPGAAPAPVLHFYDEVRFRHLALTQEEFGRFHVDIRFVGGPGECSKWEGRGKRQEKDFVFSRVVGEEENHGTMYLGSGGESRFTVKVKPKQEKTLLDEGIAGEYRHITEEKRFQLAKKEYEAAEKRLAEIFKGLGKSLKGEDKPIAAELKSRWPALRERLMGLAYKAPSAPTAPTKPALGSGKPDDAADKNPDRLWAQVEVTSGEIGFVSAALDPKVKDGWEGDYNDGRGGSLTVYISASSGDLRFTLNCSRGGDAQTGELGGVIPGALAKKTGATDGWVEYTHKDPAVTDATKQARIRLRRVGHYVIVEATQAERYTSRAWFDGVYRKQPPAVE